MLNEGRFDFSSPFSFNSFIIDGIKITHSPLFKHYGFVIAISYYCIQCQHASKEVRIEYILSGIQKNDKKHSVEELLNEYFGVYWWWSDFS
jgi:hypothetical protein